jgi:hypothetical protein
LQGVGEVGSARRFTVLLGLVVGVALQVAWNASGMADQTGNLAQAAT